MKSNLSIQELLTEDKIHILFLPCYGNTHVAGSILQMKNRDGYYFEYGDNCYISLLLKSQQRIILETLSVEQQNKILKSIPITY